MKLRILYLFILLTMFASCEKEKMELEQSDPDPPTNNIPEQKRIKYLALGDSYTIGQSVSVNSRYPIQLANKLEGDSILVDTTIIIARTGWRTDNLIAAIDEAELTDTFDLVSLLIGVNNQFQNASISVYEEEFFELLQTAIQFTGGDKEKVFVVSIPDYGYTPFGQNNQANISAGVDQFNTVNEDITKAEDISWFDITPISREGLIDTELVADDGLHPSGKMYKRWVESFYEEVKNKLE